MPVLDNPRHEIFATEIALNAASQCEAAKRAGYKPTRAYETGSQLVRNSKIADRITELQEAWASARLVDARKLHIRWSEMFDADIADIIEQDTATARMRLKPIHSWPKIWRQMLSSVDVKELFEHSKDGADASWDKIGELIKMKFADQLKLGELIGKLKTVDAFTAPIEKHEHVHIHVELEKRLSAGRERVKLLKSESGE